MINSTIGNYKITKLIGEGGMASVYEAEHQLLGSRVAIKVLNPMMSSNAQIKERFKNEAKIMASLDHPNILKVIDFDEKPQQLSIVMEYLDGEDLNKKIKSKGALNEKEIVAIFSQSLSAFQFAHEKGIAHRDIKPSNIFVLPDGTVKILDFGIAKLFGQNDELTQTGTQMGTPIYMSPEQVKADKTIDHRSDIYSLGVTLYYALNGKPPYDSTTSSQFDIFNKIVYEQLTLGDIHSRFDAIIRKACAKDREERFQSCKAFLSELNALPNSKNIDSNKIEGETTVIESPTKKESELEKTIIENSPKKELVLDKTIIEKESSLLNENGFNSNKGSQETKLPLTKRKKLIIGIASTVVLISALSFLVFYIVDNKDSDGDGMIDKYDHCTYIYGEIGGCPDSDSDGTPDYRDDCPDEYSENNRGCPDKDNDGVVDNEDLCPETPGNDPNGCFYFKEVSFTNESKIKTKLSVAYFHENEWKCIGWYSLDPGESYTHSLPYQFEGTEVFWTAKNFDGTISWEGTDEYFNVEYDGNYGGFETINGKLVETGGGYLKRRGFHKTVLQGEISYQSYED
jgi:serine/threonine protein kinase